MYAERGEIHPKVLEFNRVAGRAGGSWSLAGRWTSAEYQIGGRPPIDLIFTPEADEVLRELRARFGLGE